MKQLTRDDDKLLLQQGSFGGTQVAALWAVPAASRAGVSVTWPYYVTLQSVVHHPQQHTRGRCHWVAADSTVTKTLRSWCSTGIWLP